MGKTKSVIFEDMEHCLICESPYVEVHHIFYGTANRAISDKMGYVAPLCKCHHTGKQGVHFNKELDNKLKRIAQTHYEINEGRRSDFIETFGRSYIE